MVEAASFLGVKITTLRLWISPKNGNGIPFYRVGSVPRFRISELLEWSKNKSHYHPVPKLQKVQ